MEEIWKDVDGYDGIYQVSNQGRVRSFTRTVIYPSGKPHTYQGKVLNQDLSNKGYCRVTLSKNGVSKKFFVHRLVAVAFIKNENSYKVVNHKDENPKNNRVDNLEWCTQSYNINYGTRNDKLSKRAKKVKQIDFKGNVISIHKSVSEISKRFGYDFSTIYKCCRGELRSYKGYRWEYI